MGISISVAIPTYNASTFLREAIESVLAQTYSASEIIVVDDGSTDDTSEICESFGPAVKYICQENDKTLGAGARAHALRKVSGDWIALLDHDDLWEPTKLEVQVAAVEKHPDAGAVFTRYRSVYGKGQPVSEDQQVSGEMIRFESADAFHHLLHENPYCPSSALVRGDFIRKHGVTDPTSVGCADWDLWLSISRHHPIVVVDELLTDYRYSPEQYCTDKRRLAQALHRTLESQREYLHPGCEACAEAFEIGRTHVAFVNAVAARTLLDRYHTQARAGRVGEAWSSLRAAYEAAPGEVLTLRRLAAISKNGAFGAFKGLKSENH